MDRFTPGRTLPVASPSSPTRYMWGRLPAAATVRAGRFQTTRTSPARKVRRAVLRAGRHLFAPDFFSSKMRSHPASRSASRCKSRTWSSIDTRAYPIPCPPGDEGQTEHSRSRTTFRHRRMSLAKTQKRGGLCRSYRRPTLGCAWHPNHATCHGRGRHIACCKAASC